MSLFRIGRYRLKAFLAKRLAKGTDTPFATFSALSDEAWLDVIVRSIKKREIKGVRFAGFPSPETQKAIIGSSGADALKEACKFYVKVKDAARKNGVDPATATILDFGAGWGRTLRFFAREAGSGRLFGVDTSERMVDLCRTTEVPATVSRIAPGGRLPFRDGMFDVIYAYSVFTHLPERVHLDALRELARCLRPGGVLVATLQPRRFLDYCRNADPATHIWHKMLREGIERIPDAEARFDRGEFITLPNSGPDYGDVLVPVSYVKRAWADWFEICDYLDDAKVFQQAVLTAKRL